MGKRLFMETMARQLRQKADLIGLSKDYQRDLEVLRERWEIPPAGYEGDGLAQDWQTAWMASADAHDTRYSALFRAADRRSWSDGQLGRLVERDNRENPINRLWRDIRILNRRYSLGKEFDNIHRLLWQSHLRDHFVGGPIFNHDPPAIVITPTLRRGIVEAEMDLVRHVQRREFGEVPKGGRPKRGESRTIVIGETGEGKPCILLRNLSRSLLRHEWHKVEAIQQERWPDYKKREHYKPAHDRRIDLAEKGGLGTDNGQVEEDDLPGNRVQRTNALITQLWPPDWSDDWSDFENDHKRRDVIYQDRRRLQQQLKPTHGKP